MIKGFLKLTRYKKLMFLTVVFFAFLEMPFLALYPAIEKMHSTVFPEYSLSTIQTAITALNLFIIIVAPVCTLLLRKRVLTKKGCLCLGFLLIGLAGIASIFVHSKFWHLYLFSFLMGSGLGFNNVTGISIMMDEFEGDEVQLVCGVQAEFINIGGIVLSIIGGIIANVLWYGGYLLMSIALIFVVYVYIVFKGSLFGEAVTAGRSAEKRPAPTPLPKKVYYYSIAVFIVMVLYGVSGANISTHIAKMELGGTSVSGVANSMCMIGGIAAAIVFAPLAKKFGDNLMTISVLLMAIGFTMLNVFASSMIVMMISLFLIGSCLGLFPPQIIASTSGLVDKTNSSTATMIENCIFSAAGALLSPSIMTNITTLLGGESTRFRFQFTGICCLVYAVILFFINRAYARKEAGAAQTVKQ
ncbi:MAG: MFS transporter [Synergistes sp.]|nr:MFS transporter [Synergistes sp.]